MMCHKDKLEGMIFGLIMSRILLPHLYKVEDKIFTAESSGPVSSLAADILNRLNGVMLSDLILLRPEKPECKFMKEKVTQIDKGGGHAGVV